MSITWHSLAQRVLGEPDEVWQLASDKLTKARFDVFGDVATSMTGGDLHDTGTQGAVPTGKSTTRSTRSHVARQEHLDKDKPGRQPEEGESCHRHIEQGEVLAFLRRR